MSICSKETIITRAASATEESQLSVYKIHNIDGTRVLGLYDCIFTNTVSGIKRAHGFDDNYIGMYSAKTPKKQIIDDLRRADL